MISYSNSLLRGSGMPIQVNGAFLRAPCPVPSCPACEPNSGSVHPSLSTKATQVERGRHCYAIKWVLVFCPPIFEVVLLQEWPELFLSYACFLFFTSLQGPSQS